MNTFNYKFLGKLIEEQYANNKNFAKELNRRGLTKGEDSIKKWRQGNAVPKLLELPTIAKALNVNINDFFEGFETTQIVKKALETSPELYKILIPSLDKNSEKTYLDAKLIKNLDYKNLRCYTIRNVALEPKFSLNDNVLIELLKHNFKKKNGLYLIKEGECTYIKYIKFMEKKTISYNLDGSEPLILDAKHSKIIAKIHDKIIENY